MYTNSVLINPYICIIISLPHLLIQICSLYIYIYTKQSTLSLSKQSTHWSTFRLFVILVFEMRFASRVYTRFYVWKEREMGDRTINFAVNSTDQYMDPGPYSLIIAYNKLRVKQATVNKLYTCCWAMVGRTIARQSTFHCFAILSRCQKLTQYRSLFSLSLLFSYMAYLSSLL